MQEIQFLAFGTKMIRFSAATKAKAKAKAKALLITNFLKRVSFKLEN
jgi:hypothetical protein